MMILHFLCRLEQTIFYMKQEIEQKELGMGNFQGFREKILEGGEDKFTDVIAQPAVAQL